MAGTRRSSRRRRRRAIALLVAIGVLVLACGAGAAFRYARFCSCGRQVAEAQGAVARLADDALRPDLSAHTAYLEARLAKGWLYAKRDVFLGRLRREASELLEACRGAVPSPHLRPGHHVIVTVSRVDGAQMPTSVTVPEGWDGVAPLPLVLCLHAGGVDEMVDCFPAPSYSGALCVEPLARGSHDYVGVQMSAVEECLADVQRRYPTGGLYVIGTSMGGMAAWLFAERHAGEVRGVSPWAANADPEAWKGVWEAAEDAPRSPASEANRLAQAALSPVARVEQLVSQPDLPIYVGHGTADTIIPIGHSESMVEKLRQAGATRVRFDRFAGRGHKDIPRLTRQRIAWLMEQGEPRAEDGLVAAIPPLTFVGDGLGLPPHRVLDPMKEAQVVIRAGQFAAGVNAEPASPVGPSKWHYAGPAGAAFDHPFSVALPPDAPAPLRECAEELAGIWERRYGGTVRRSDARAGFAAFPERQDEQERRTLIALGSPEENPAVQAALEGLDVHVAPGAVRLFGRDWSGEDVGLIILRPHPTDFYGGTLVVWGSTPASYRQLWRRFGHAVRWEGARGRWWFDYAVFDRKTCGPDSFLLVGYFDHGWRFDPGLLLEGSGELRESIPGNHWAIGTAAEGHRTWLSSLAPDAVESPRGSLGFDRSAGVDAGPLTIQGEHYSHGLGMVPPASVRWRLGGRFAELRAKVGLERSGERWPIRYAAEKVRFEVWGDGRLLAASPVLSATDGGVELVADLGGVDVLELRAVNTTTHIWHYGPVVWASAELRCRP